MIAPSQNPAGLESIGARDRLSTKRSSIGIEKNLSRSAAFD
jgi:hypothetical protein